MRAYPAVNRMFELDNGGRIERAYVYCEWGGCRDLTTRTIVEDEDGVQAWAERHMSTVHGLTAYKVIGAWPVSAWRRVWKQSDEGLELAVMVKYGGMTVDEVVEDTGLDDEIADVLREMLSESKWHRFIRKKAALEFLKEHPGASAEQVGEYLRKNANPLLNVMRKEGLADYVDNGWYITNQ